MSLKTIITLSLFALLTNITNAQNHQDSLQQELLEAIQTAPILEKLEPNAVEAFIATDPILPFISENSLESELPNRTNQEVLTFAPEAIALESSRANSAVNSYTSRANNTAHPSCPFILTANRKITVNFTQVNQVACVSLNTNTQFKIDALLNYIPQGNNYDLFVFENNNGHLLNVPHNTIRFSKEKHLTYLSEAGKSYVLAVKAVRLQTAGTVVMSFNTLSLKGMDKYEFNDNRKDATPMGMNMYTDYMKIDHLSDVDYYRYKLNMVQDEVGVRLQADQGLIVEVWSKRYESWKKASGGGWNNARKLAGWLGMSAEPLSDVYFRVRPNISTGFNSPMYRLWFSTKAPRHTNMAIEIIKEYRAKGDRKSTPISYPVPDQQVWNNLRLRITNIGNSPTVNFRYQDSRGWQSAAAHPDSAGIAHVDIPLPQCVPTEFKTARVQANDGKIHLYKYGYRNFELQVDSPITGKTTHLRYSKICYSKPI